MSKIEELIQKYCPNGVEYVPLKTIINYKNGKGHEKIIDNNGEFIVVNSKFISTEGKTRKYSNTQICPVYENDILLVLSDLPNGKALAKCFFVDKDNTYTLNQRICSLSVINIRQCLPKFYFYYLNRNENLLKHDNGVDQTNLKRTDIENLEVPLPAMPVQRKIVRILDEFSLLSTELSTELAAELAARKKQYEFYRNKLLTFENKVIEKNLSEILNIKNGKDYKQFSYGKYPVYGSGGIMTYIDHYAFDKPSVLIPRKGSLNKLYYVEEPFWTVDTLFYTEIDEKQVVPKYVYYYLQMKHLEDLNEAGGVPSLTQSVLNRVKICLPSLSIQERIVKVLDNFDAICSDLNIALSAEMEARQKQYEYYRDKLLTFKRLNS